METEAVFILLFVVATAVAIAVQRWTIPYTAALMAAGLVLGFLQLFPAPHLTKALLFNAFLPGLLFEAAFYIEFRQFWRNRLAIASLALPGLAAAIALTTLVLPRVAGGLHFVEGFTWQHALVFGAIISATDPVAVIAVFRSLGVPKRLSVLLEGESLLNDGTAIAFFTLSLALAAGRVVAPADLGLMFVKIVGLGALIGMGLGLGVSQVLRQVDEPMIEITLTTIAAYGSFLAAEHFHASGVIATVCAGMLCGNYGARVGMTPSTRIAVETFWEYVAFALNSIVFLLIGLEVRFQALIDSWRAILAAYLVVTGARMVIIFGVGALLRGTRERIPKAWCAVLTWGGLRGGLPMVLALSLPQDFAQRELLISMTFGVVVLSIMVHGLSMSPLLRLLGVARGRRDLAEYELSRGRLQAAHAALEELDRLAHVRFTAPGLVEDLRCEYERRIERETQALHELHLDSEQLRAEEAQWARRHLLQVEKGVVSDAFHRGALSQEVQERLLADIDGELLRLASGEAAGDDFRGCAEPEEEEAEKDESGDDGSTEDGPDENGAAEEEKEGKAGEVSGKDGKKPPVPGEGGAGEEAP
ncbi:Na+/H+ antiporter [Desulfovibrio sp. X2]|uniref:Na+/H+ antiporter n=1 Tax=Desulfovibrio sp. X2 TaxID=941449 RepID=UPI0003588A70|nr:Na+/H+ antiporter [Desulfovibrio sp. X2]EPR41169.1 Na+/H+ antiporter [Desulfovibrio sp. X2]